MLITFVILICIVLFILSGVYKGFIWNSLVFFVSLISLILAFIFVTPVSKLFRGNESFYNSMLSYTEGSEHVYDVELRKVDITEISDEKLDEIMEKSNLVHPMDKRVRTNIEKRAFEDEGITTIGDYFNETLVRTAINIFCFFGIYLVLRLIGTFVICWIDYVNRFKKLKKYDYLADVVVAILRAYIGISVVFIAVPIVLTVLDFDIIRELFENNFLVNIFYRSNFILPLIRGI